MNTEPILSHFKSQAIAAHNNTSFSPKRRGEQLVNEFSEELTADMEELKNGGATDESIADYQSRYERFFSSYLGAKSRCISSMITGSSRFPVRRAEKANRSEHNHYLVFREWRTRAKKAIIRKLQPAKTISSELERYKNELASCQRSQELMKACNVVIRKAKGNDCTEELIKAGLSESNARKIQLPGQWWGKGFAPFSLTNNNANIKRIEAKVKEMESKEFNSKVVGEEVYLFNGGKVILNHPADRIQIFFDERPTTQQLAEWKTKGLSSFNWSPSAKAWQRKITGNAMYTTKLMFKGLGLLLSN